MLQNPFFVGGPVPPQYFIGRISEIRTAFDQISKRGHLAIYGNSGMGKSSILQFLASPSVWQAKGQEPSQAFIIYMNCTGISPFTPSGFWREVLTLLKDEAEGDAALQSAIDEVLQEEIIDNGELRKILRQIGQQNKFLLLLLDDYDVALCANDSYTEAQMLTFLSEFRNLAVHSKEGRCLSTIVTTFRRLNELGPKITPVGSPWYNHYQFRLIRPLPTSEVYSQLGLISIPLNLKAGVLELIGGHPALLQNAGYLLHDTLQLGQTVDIKAFTRDFQSATEQYFQDTWAFSTDEEQILLMLIALCRLEGSLNEKRRYSLGDIDLLFSQRSRELIDLEERGVIKRTVEEEKTIYNFASSMMEWWVIQEIENSNEPELERREKMFLNLMSRAQAKQVQNAIRWIWQNRDAVQSSMTWLISKLGGVPT